MGQSTGETKPCPACREDGRDKSGDNLVLYEDGSGHCFACGYDEQPDGTGTKAEEVEIADTFLRGHFSQLPDRKITEDTCRQFGYQVKRENGQIIQIANYIRNNKVVAQKLRYPPDEDGKKRFAAKGMKKDEAPPLFGQHVWAGKGKKLVITEGEIDAMAAAQMLDTRWWAVVSIGRGAASAQLDFRQNLEFINSYDEVYICFDNDQAGNDAAAKCAELVKPGKARVVHMILKDAGEYLKEGRTKEFCDLCWQAEAHRPDGILHAREVDLTKESIGMIMEYPWPSMTRALYGRRGGELVMHTSGSGMGKSTVLREMQYHDLIEGRPVGVLALEESVQDTLHDLMTLKINKPVKKILAVRAINEQRQRQGLDPMEFEIQDNLTEEEYLDALAWFRSKELYLYDHFGSLESDRLMGKLDYLCTGLGCMNIYVDHISIIVSGMDNGNERKDIDVLMTNLRSFVERTGCLMDAVCHLSKPDGRPFEEGGQISLRDLRGSGGLYQMSDSVLGYERNQQADDIETKNTIRVRSLKDRFGGNTSIISALRWNPDQGRLREMEFEYDADGNIQYFDPSGSVFADVIDKDLTDIVQEEACIEPVQGASRVRL